MSEKIKELKAVQQEIKDLIQKEVELKSKHEDELLNNKERNELESYLLPLKDRRSSGRDKLKRIIL